MPLMPHISLCCAVVSMRVHTGALFPSIYIIIPLPYKSPDEELCSGKKHSLQNNNHEEEVSSQLTTLMFGTACGKSLTKDAAFAWAACHGAAVGAEDAELR